MLPNFLIIGAMRSGTTSLARRLRVHPDVFIPPRKELRYFDRNYDKGVQWYRKQFEGVRTETAIGEATQTYMYYPKALDRMSAIAADARLIAILRDPVDRAYSHYWQNRALGKEPLNFEDAIAAEPERLANGDLDAQLTYSYLDRGRYFNQLARVCEHYARKALLVILFDDLFAAPHDTYRVVCRFLNVDEDFETEELGRVNNFVTFRSLKLRALTRRLPRSLARVAGRINTRPASYPEMDPATRVKIQGILADETHALAAWLGRELSEWNQRR